MRRRRARATLIFSAGWKRDLLQPAVTDKNGGRSVLNGDLFIVPVAGGEAKRIHNAAGI